MVGVLAVITVLTALTTPARSQEKCPDGEVAVFECNQESKVCEDDPELKCVELSGTYYCCAGGDTVETTTAAACEDSADADCPTLKDYCTEKDTMEDLKTLCPKTCGYCGGGGGGGDGCKNKFEGPCKIWNKYGFCKTDKISSTKKKELCGKACSLC